MKNVKPTDDDRPSEASVQNAFHRPQFRTASSLHALEPRIVFDGAFVDTADTVDDHVAEQSGSAAIEEAANSIDDIAVAEAFAPSPSNRNEIAFIDASVSNVEDLLEGIGTHVDIILLDPDEDGVEQIAAALSEREDIDAVHILSHGQQGSLQLGNAVLNASSMQGEHLDELTAIGASLNLDGDILIYGCDFTGGEGGLQAAILLGSLTGADIAASEDRTGPDARGGDWDLETEVGEIEAERIAAENWDGLLSSGTPVDVGEVGTVDVDSNGTTVTLTNTYTNAVVFVFTTTENETSSHPDIARVTNITSNSFDVAIVEPNSGNTGDPTDGVHGFETVSYIVMEAGVWTAPDGTRIEVGTIDTATAGDTFTGVSFSQNFSSSPIVLSQVQSNTNSVSYNEARQTGVTKTGFQVTNEPADFEVGSITSQETIGYLAIEGGTGTWDGLNFEAGLTADNVTHGTRTISFTNDLGADVRFLGQLHTFDGPDNAHADARNLTGTGVSVSVQEDHTLDTEINHTTERVGWLAFSGSGTLSIDIGTPPVAEDDMIDVVEDTATTFNPLDNDSDADGDVYLTEFSPSASGLLELEIGEAGTVDADSSGMTVTFTGQYTNPVVFAFTTTENEDSSEPDIARVTNVTGNSFDLAIVETNSGRTHDSTDGVHGMERVSYIVVEAGVWTLADGTVVEVGRQTIGTNASSFTSVSFDHAFLNTPTVISQVQTDNSGVEFNNARQRNVTGTGYQVTNEPADYQSNFNFVPNPESIGYIAIERGTGTWSGLSYEAGATGNNVTHASTGIEFTNDLGSDVNFLAQLDTFDGGDNAHVDASNLTGTGATVSTQEDRTSDSEINHTTEVVSWFALGGSGTLTAESGTNFSIASSDASFRYTSQDDVNGETVTFGYTVRDDIGNTDTATVTLNITPEPDTVTDTVSTPEENPVSFNVLDNDEFEGAVTLTAISAPANGSVSFDAAGNVTYTPNTNFSGTETLTYTITEDDLGVTETGTVEITVTPVNDAPVAVDDAFTTDEDTAVSGNVILGNGDDIDVDMDPLTVVVPVAGTITTDQGGTVTIAANGSFTYTPPLNFNGTDRFDYDVTDGVLTDTGTVTLTVNAVNDAPVAVDDAFTTDEDTAVSGNVISGSGNDTDVELDPLSVVLPVSGTITTDQGGTVVIASDGSFTYTPPLNFYGTDRFDYDVTDGDLTDTGTVILTVNAVNDAPVAVDDAFTTDEDTAVNGNVISGSGDDIDVDMDPLTIVVPVSGTITTDQGGTVTIAADGSFTYTPPLNFNGTDRFDYDVTDGVLTDTGTVTLTVNAANDAPVAIDDAFTTDEDTAASGNVISGSGDDTDVDMDPLTVVVPVSGTITTDRGGTVVIAIDGSFTYTPPLNFNGTDRFDYDVTDGNLTDTGTVTLTVNAVNDAPVAVDDAFTTEEDTAVSGNVISGSGDDTDADMDPLTVVVPASGTITTDQGGMVTIARDGSFTYLPPLNFSGSDRFSYEITDGAFYRLASVTLTIEPINDAPVATAQEYFTAEDVPVQGNLILQNTGAGVDSDIDGDALSIDPSSIGTFRTAQGGTIRIAADGRFDYTPPTNFYGEDTFVYTVTDGDLTNTALVTFLIYPVTDTLFETNDDDAVAALPRRGADPFEDSVLAEPIVISAVQELQDLQKNFAETFDFDFGTDVAERVRGWSLTSVANPGADTDEGASQSAWDARVVINTLAIDQILFVEIAQFLRTSSDAGDVQYVVHQANRDQLPEWIRQVDGGALLIEAPVGLDSVELMISGANGSGYAVAMFVTLDLYSGEVRQITDPQDSQTAHDLTLTSGVE